MSTYLILGGTGKTGRRVARELQAAGAGTRTAARSGADVRFDWDDASSRAAALEGVSRVYLVPPTHRLDQAPVVGAFLDQAEAAGVEHVTFLSAWGVQHAPPEAVALRAIELDLGARAAFTHSLLRPSWFMQNLTEDFLQAPIAGSGVIPVPAGDGAEAFIDARDIAAAAAATLLDPGAHAGRAFDLTGPEALTHAQLAEVVGAQLGRTVTYVDVPAAAWVEQAVAGGLPADYAGMLAGLFDLIKSGDGAQPTSGVRDATGRAPRSFAQFAKEAAAAGSWSAPALA